MAHPFDGDIPGGHGLGWGVGPDPRDAELFDFSRGAAWRPQVIVNDMPPPRPRRTAADLLQPLHLVGDGYSYTVEPGVIAPDDDEAAAIAALFAPQARDDSPQGCGATRPRGDVPTLPPLGAEPRMPRIPWLDREAIIPILLLAAIFIAFALQASNDLNTPPEQATYDLRGEVQP